jgi:trigger factor
VLEQVTVKDTAGNPVDLNEAVQGDGADDEVGDEQAVVAGDSELIDSDTTQSETTQSEQDAPAAGSDEADEATEAPEA